MLFNSFDFGFFLVIVYALYWAIGVKRRKGQNALLLFSSYLFYGLWDWRFLGLLLASSLIDYIAGISINKTEKKSIRKLWLYASVLWNLGILVTFKYFNFFINSFGNLFNIPITEGSFTIWTVIIPLGLSFYTFQTMSYTIDVYKKRIPPTRNLLSFLCFVSFFPQLVAGPIERAKKLLPQFERERSFNLNTSTEGLRQILWGLFKKVLVADKLGIAVTMVFNNPEQYGAGMLLFAAVLFSLQVYCDFSGYTDIAIGTAKLFGFKLSKNFNLPYLAKNITEFWQRWHITLTNWFTDYVYIPLVKSSNKVNSLVRGAALLLTMLLVGFWHGANWTFICFGIFNGFILIAERIKFGHNFSLRKGLAKAPRLVSLGYFFFITSISSIFFRAESSEQAFLILKRIFTFQLDATVSSLIGFKLLFLVAMILAELATRNWDFPLQKLEIKLPRAVRWAVYYILIMLLIRYSESGDAFIYFQF
ncbi:MBOAT family O-acyltransferase [Jejudonia soesokkakensis]|uniref:MBOAT family O-acyltransferase n=1 Tax=Jejudonia soesokkakensis TaxID=1323432 RepID=A0ABW2MYH9_9FLAO